ncbi:cytochrome c maturation protein CcmE [Terriglobus saanensis]|uniref:Putative cytochrome c-type biogenesis protein n=1 Tax=Terriglobus saanensis (strain ATCC BAA-1853 / DSM 23119 / SP1PR4) TaxID=401053 RepID=E8V4U1_TERSS|nr:cytochrome c maturation protein CcmE [Terriglobus saanensis]ADV82569.1 putative cytochrome c-type biogenesis protein [Terriglobus saanensis SP1PR4]
MKNQRQIIRFVIAAVIIVGTVTYLAITGANAGKSYYCTIAEMHGMGDKAYSRSLRVAGNVKPGSIHRFGPRADFILLEQGKELPVNYMGSEPPPDTFKDDAQALAMGHLGRDGVFHANQLQAKCASKYAPVDPKKQADKPATTAAVIVTPTR